MSSIMFVWPVSTSQNCVLPNIPRTDWQNNSTINIHSQRVCKKRIEKKLDFGTTSKGKHWTKKYVRKITIYYLTFSYVNVKIYNDGAGYIYCTYIIHYIILINTTGEQILIHIISHI